MIYDKARIIWTFDCKRNCDYCCNKYTHIIDNATDLHDLLKLSDFDIIMISGGEPMLYPQKLISFINEIKEINNTALIYLYTAWFDESIKQIINLVDGIHFTLHSTSNLNDIKDFYKFQDIISEYTDKSFRLYINPNITQPISIIPNLWKRVEIKPWLTENETELPEGEILFIYKNLFKSQGCQNEKSSNDTTEK